MSRERPSGTKELEAPRGQGRFRRHARDGQAPYVGHGQGRLGSDESYALRSRAQVRRRHQGARACCKEPHVARRIRDLARDAPRCRCARAAERARCPRIARSTAGSGPHGRAVRGGLVYPAARVVGQRRCRSRAEPQLPPGFDPHRTTMRKAAEGTVCSNSGSAVPTREGVIARCSS